MESSTKTFGILCLSSAIGLSLYWTMFLMNNFPRMTRFGLNMPEMNISTGIVGAVCVVLFTIGIVSVKARPAKPAKTLVLARNAEGRVVSIKEAEYGRVARGKAKATTPKVKPLEEAPQIQKPAKAKYVIGVAVLIALVGGYASMMVMMGYTLQDVASGMYTPFMAVSSQSMQPVLNYGDLIIVRRETAEGIAVGDIIAFNVPSPYDRWAPSPTVHRVVEKLVVDGKTFFKTKGDNNPREDPWIVPAENVIGKYAGKIPYVGLIVLSLRSPLGLALAAVLIALAFIYPYSKKKRGVRTHDIGTLRTAGAR